MKYIFIALTYRVNGYIVVVGKYVTGIRIFLIRITSRFEL